MFRNEITIRTVEGHDVLITLRRFGLINKESRKEMLRRRRVEQLSRVGGGYIHQYDIKETSKTKR